MEIISRFRQCLDKSDFQLSCSLTAESISCPKWTSSNVYVYAESEHLTPVVTCLQGRRFVCVECLW